MNPPTTLPCAFSGLTLELRSRLTCRCPVNKRVDHALVAVTYQPRGVVLTYEAFFTWLDHNTLREVTHEDVTGQLLAWLVETVTPQSALVTTHWEPVEGVTVTVSAKHPA